MSSEFGEYRVSYYEPYLGWCNLIQPYPEGTVYRIFEDALAAAMDCRLVLDRSVRVYHCGAWGTKLVHEIIRLIDGVPENLPEA